MSKRRVLRPARSKPRSRAHLQDHRSADQASCNRTVGAGVFKFSFCCSTLQTHRAATAITVSLRSTASRDLGNPQTGKGFQAHPDYTGIGASDLLGAAVEDAFPGSRVSVENIEGRFALTMAQHGLLRPLGTAELSDGTLRYLLWIAALLTPRPLAVMVLNEPETSLHPDLLGALARLIGRASERTQIIVVTHATRLISALAEQSGCHSITLKKILGETTIADAAKLGAVTWHWPGR